MKIELRDYQGTASDFLFNQPYSALLLDPGLGKSLVTLHTLDRLRKAKRFKRVLIIAPLTVCKLVWPYEIKKWGLDFQHVIVHGRKKESLIHEDSDITIINPENLVWLYDHFQCKWSLSKWLKKNFNILVVDELTRFKTRKTQCFRALSRLLPTFDVRWGLTGSIIANGLEQIFWQMFVIDGGASLGKYITKFREKYFDPPGYLEYKWKPKLGALEAVQQDIAAHALYMRAEDYLKLPNLIENLVYVDLPVKAYKAYKDVEKNFFHDFNSQIVNASNVVSAIAKCRQMANGSVFDIDGEVIDVHDAKVDALTMLLEELEESPVLIVIEYSHDVHKINKRLGGIPVINGETSLRNREKIANDWNAGLVKRLMVHPKSAGHGLNLQGSSANHIIYYSLQYNAELDDQVLRRIYRQGNESERIFCHRILARNTIDDVLLATVRAKMSDQNTFLKNLSEYGKLQRY